MQINIGEFILTASFLQRKLGQAETSLCLLHSIFSPPVIIPYAVLLAAEGFSQAELKYLTRHDSLKELERYMTHITPELKQKKTRSGVLH